MGVSARKLLILLAILACAAPASAQIYSWHDANGNLVLSNTKPSATPERTFDVPKAETVRATRAAAPVAADRATQYDDVIAEHARANGVRPDLVRAVVQVESAFNPFARSAKGALGLMQLMPATLRDFGVRNPFDPIENIRAGVAYLRQLLDRYRNNEQLALAAYNAGPKAVDKHGETVPPYRETQNYVTKIDKMAGTPKHQGKVIYKIIDIVDGEPVARYTDQKPKTGAYEVVVH